MNTPHCCPKCGALLPADAPEDLCPACLLSGALPSEAGTVKMTPSQKPSVHEPVPTLLPEELAPLFPQLEIIGLLGRGGMGAVYKARQPKLNRFVALKIISGDAAADPHFAERFQREAQALAKLNHPHIVSVFDFGETGGLFYFLMEFVDGANLRTLMQSGEMKPEAALGLIPAFCDALQYAHDEGVVHRDIKPENVLVDKKGRLKIADFGLAKLTGSDAHDHTLTRTGMYLGTPRYMAPEQVEKPETVDHRADIYSLGVVFYEMLTGELPMGRFDPPSKKVQVDVKLDDIVLRSLEKDVDRRYQHASEIKTDVQSVAAKSAAAGAKAEAAPFIQELAETFPIQFMPRDSTDYAFGAAATLVIGCVFIVLPGLLVYFACAGLGLTSAESAASGFAGGLGFALVYALMLGAGSVRSVSVDRRGLMLNRVMGAGRLLPWLSIQSIQTMPRWDAARVMLWPGYPVRGSILGMSSLHYYRIACADGCWHFGPREPEKFLEAVNRWRGMAADVSANEQRVVKENTAPSEPRLSRMALIGAIWVVFGLIAVIPSVLFTKMVALSEGRPSSLVYEQPPVAFTVFMGVLLFIGMGAPIGTTILGAISMGNIKRSSGKLYGLPLAFADTVFFPMLLLHGAMAVMLGVLVLALFKLAGEGGALGVIEMALLAMLPLIADFFIVRALWRKVAGNAANSANPPSAPWKQRSRGWPWLMTGTALVLVIGGAVLWQSNKATQSRLRELIASGGPRIAAEKMGALEPEQYRYRYQIHTPPDHRVVMWMETTRNGKPVVIPGLANNISSSTQLSIGERFDGDAEFSLMEGSRITPESKGKWRWDFKHGTVGKNTHRISPGGWIEPPFAGMSTSVHQGPKFWEPKPGEEVSILVIRGGSHSYSSDPTEEPPAGEIELRLKARIDPVPLFHRVQGSVGSSLRDPFPTPATPLGRIAAGFRIDPKLPEDEIRRQMISELTTNDSKRLNAEMILQSVGKPVTRETKPEDVLKALESVAQTAK